MSLETPRDMYRAMHLNKPLVIYREGARHSGSMPQFCRRNKLFSRLVIQWDPEQYPEEALLTLVKRVMKLFPFEGLAVEVDCGRRCDVFPDWDSYLEWLSAQEPNQEGRLFSRIKIFRQKRVLGFIAWEKGLTIYTEQDQTTPITQACETLGPVELIQAPPKPKNGLLASLALQLTEGLFRKGPQPLHNRLFEK